MPFPEYEQFPPKNRLAETLEFPWIEIDDATTKYRTDPNALVGCVIWMATGQPPSNPDGIVVAALPNGAVVFNPLELVPREDVPSILSGGASVGFRHDDMSIDLTPEEFARFVSRMLTPEEYMALRDHFGMFYDIHADFYDDQNGHSYNSMASLFGDDLPPVLRGPGM
jgi:hypothetical protein